MEKRKVMVTNRKARHDYELLESFEAGLVLMGSEIKSIRAGKASLQEAFVQPRDGEIWILGMFIAPYMEASYLGHEERRPRKLLLNRREIDRISSRVAEKGLTIVPTLLYLKNGLAKLEISLARGKRQYDKRDALRKRDSQRQIERSLRER